MNRMDDSVLLKRIAEALERTADSQAQISSFLLRIADFMEADVGEKIEEEEW